MTALGLCSVLSVFSALHLALEPPPDDREPEPFREPVPCPVCGGSGGSVRDGACDACEGTGIDPDDPAFPA